MFISTLNTDLPLFNPQAKVSLDAGLSFFTLSGEEDSVFGWSSEQVGFVPLPLAFSGKITLLKAKKEMLGWEIKFLLLSHLLLFELRTC